MHIRKAKTEESDLLSSLAYRSKAYWGYDMNFMEKARDDLTISSKSILENHVYVLESETTLIGFFCLIMRDERKELDFFFIEPEFIGKGYGKALWEGFLAKAKEAGGGDIKIIADPNAAGFYKKMGAVQNGEHLSAIFENRKLPLMYITV